MKGFNFLSVSRCFVIGGKGMVCLVSWLVGYWLLILGAVLIPSKPSLNTDLPKTFNARHSLLISLFNNGINKSIHFKLFSSLSYNLYLIIPFTRNEFSSNQLHDIVILRLITRLRSTIKSKSKSITDSTHPPPA